MERTVGELPKQLAPSVREYAAQLERSLDLQSEDHQRPSEALASWISMRLTRGKNADVIVICTGNSRRSVLGSIMGNVAASYHGLANVRFYSGGTTPSALNARTARALTEVGITVIPTGNEAQRGETQEPNPIYQVSWGSGDILEFSKVYNDPPNPQTEFAALLVCTEADGACPTVDGASVRIPCPFDDPKDADGTEADRLRYSERRDEIGRFMLSVTREVKKSFNR